MSLRYFALATFTTLPAIWAACDETPNGCEDAKGSIETQIKEDVCADPAYAGSPFCTCCVAHGYYSVSNDCTCRPLLFDTAECYFAVGAQAMPQARAAVEYANSICSGRDVIVPDLDAGAAPCFPPSMTTSSSTSSSSGIQGAGGAGMTTNSSSGMPGTGGGP